MTLQYAFTFSPASVLTGALLRVMINSNVVPFSIGSGASLRLGGSTQGYLAHKKHPPPRTLQ